MLHEMLHVRYILFDSFEKLHAYVWKILRMEKYLPKFQGNSVISLLSDNSSLTYRNLSHYVNFSLHFVRTAVGNMTIRARKILLTRVTSERQCSLEWAWKACRLPIL